MIVPLLMLLGSASGASWFATSEASAAPKTIAIVNLSAEPDSTLAAERARQLLEKSSGLRANTPGDLARALEGALPAVGPDALVLADASEALAAAQKAFAAFQSNETRTQLERARRLLFTLTPSEDATKLLAEVSFRMALLHLRDENRGLAMDELQLLHRLDESTSIDPVRYPPDVVNSFKAAQRMAPKDTSATLSISATDDGAAVFLDGKAVGSSPLPQLAVTAGVHIISVAAPKYQAAAQKITVDAGARKQLRIDLEPRAQTTRALDLRFQARQGGLRETDLKEAAAKVVRLIGSDAVLVIRTSAAGHASASMYVPGIDRLSFQHAVDTQLDQLFGLVLDVQRPEMIDTTGPIRDVPWYKRPLVGLAAIGGALAVGAVAAFTFSSSDQTPPPRDLAASWEL